MKKLLSVILTIVMLILPVAEIVAFAAPQAVMTEDSAGEASLNTGDSYAELSGDNYTNLDYFVSVSLTGDMATDIANIAYAQVGKTYYDLGYDEIGATYWCARFVSDCARIAGVPLNVIGKTAGASAESFGLTKNQIIDKSNAKNGDLVFWVCNHSDCSDKPNWHVGIYYNGKVVSGSNGSNPSNVRYYSDSSYTHGNSAHNSYIEAVYYRPNYLSEEIEYATITDGEYYLKNGDYYLDYVVQTTKKNTLTGTTSSKSEFEITDDGDYYKIVSTSSTNGYVVNVNASDSYNGASVILWSDTTNPSQRWYFEECGDGYLIHPADAIYLSLTRDTSTNGISVKTTTKADNQIWKLEKETTPLVMNSSNTATITTGGEMVYYEYTPTSSREYVIYSTGSSDTRVYLYDEDLNEITSDDDGGNNANFCLVHRLTAGTKYIFGIKFYNSSTTGNITFKFGRVYTITYDSNGGTGAPVNQTKLYGKSLTLSNVIPTRSGYTFKGWSEDPGGNETWHPEEQYNYNASLDLYAVWQANTRQLTANTSNTATITTGGEMAYYEFTPNETDTYVIYSTGSEDTRVYLYDEDENQIDSDDDSGENGNFELQKRLTAGVKYRFGIRFYSSSKTGNIPFKLGKTYPIYFDANGGNISGADAVGSEYVWGKNFVFGSSTPTRNGYTFNGWATSVSGDVEYLPGDTYTVNGAITFYAQWSPIKYTIRYDANGGIGAPANERKVHDINHKLSSTIPTRTGYTFKGWSTSANGSVSYASGATYTANSAVTLYAVWQANTYTITYNANGGSGVPENQTKTHDIDIALGSKTPRRAGYIFMGWSTERYSNTAEYQAGENYTGNTDLNLYAVWKGVVFATKVTLSTTKATMAVGQETELSATLTPANSTDTLTWSVDKPEIATVDENGVVFAHKAGKVKVTAMAGSGKKATCTVTVGEPATKVDLTALKTTSLAVGKTLTLKGKAARDDKVKPVSTAVVFEIIEGEEYATIDAKGKLKGVATGEVVVRARAEAGTDDAYADVIINVCVPATKVKLNTTKASMVVGGEDLYLTAELSPEDNTDTLTWSVDKEDFATVDENGVVTAHSAGKVKVTAMTGSGKKATCTVTVGVPATKVEFTSLKATSLAVGKTLSLKAKASRVDNVKPVSTNVVYEIIEGQEYATIDAKGKLKAISTGEVVVRAWAEAGTEDAYADVTINVCIPATKVKLNMTKATVSVGDELQLEADITPVDNTDTLTWISANEDIATVDENGLVTVHEEGKVKITAKTGSGKSATCTVTVTE